MPIVKVLLRPCVMPSTYLIDDKLEFVARYVYQASENEGILPTAAIPRLQS